jgi:DNA polymerase-3 subunit delta
MKQDLIASYFELMKDLDSGQIQPLYFFFGSEEALIGRAIDRIKGRLIQPETVDFNYNQFFGKETDMIQIVDIAYTLPVMSERRLVVIKQAEKLELDKSTPLETLLKKPPASSCLIFCLNTVDMKKKFFKGLAELRYLYNFSDIPTPQIEQFIRQEAQKSGKRISSETTQFFIDQVGTSLQPLMNELAKLINYVGNRNIIEIEDINAVSGKIHSETIFQFVDACCEGRADLALPTLEHMLEAGEAPLKILAMIARQYRLIWSFKGKGPQDTVPGLPPFLAKKVANQARRYSPASLRRVFIRLKDTDIALKSRSVNKNMLIEQLVLDLMVISQS